MDNFDNLLQWLDPDRDRAAVKYEEIRRALIRIFMHRGCVIPEDLADLTIERVTTKIERVSRSFSPEDNPALYFFKVSQYIFHEYLKRRFEPIPPPPVEKEDLEPELDCIDRCLERLTAEDRDLILAYYPSEGSQILARKRLADRDGLGLNALRIRACRIRSRLEDCARECLKQKVVK